MSSPNHHEFCPQNLATQPDQIPPKTSDTTKTATSDPDSGHLFGIEPILPKSKAPKRAVRTTSINADITNFKAIVQKLTGYPQPNPLQPLESQKHPVREHAQQLFLQTREEEGNLVNTLSSSSEGEKSKDNKELIRDPSPDNTSLTSPALVESKVQEEETTNPTPEDTYEVYLSFSDETHKSFADFLYTYLVDIGIRIFEENIDLRSGKDTVPMFINYSAIKKSKISIPIFSKNYASSTRCMHELTHMVQCHTTDGLKILPIFYDVEPNQVQHQLGSYREAFRQHETTYDEKTLQEWKMALVKVADMRGFVLHKR